MAKKIASILFITIALLILGVFCFGDKALISESMGQYEVAGSVSGVVCRVMANGATEDIHVSMTSVGNVLFLPSGTKSIAFLNLSNENTSVLPFEAGRYYDLPEVEDRLEKSGEVGGETLELQKSENTKTVYVKSDDSVESIDSERAMLHEATSTVVSEAGDIQFSGELEYIKPRGVTSFTESPKKSYEMRFKKKTELIDGSKEKEWLLIANYKDNTLIRNKVIYDFVNEYTFVKAPQAEYADVYINGYYRGNYLLCEKVKNGTDLLDISEPENDITGGYLLKFVTGERVGDNPYIQTDLGYFAEVVSPKTVTEEELEYLSGFFAELETVASNNDYVLISKYLDIDSWVDKYLIENVFQNVDSSFDSSYFYKVKDSDGGKLYAGPAWDYDLTAIDKYSAWDTDRVGDFYLCDELIENAEIKDRIGERFSNVFEPYVKYSLSADIYELSNKFGKSFAMDNNLWNTAKERGIDDFIARTQNRLEVINKKVLGNSTDHVVTFVGYNDAIVETRVVADGEALYDLPTTSNWWAYFNGWVDARNNQKLKEGTPVYEDKTYKADWVDSTLMIKNVLIVLGIDVDNLSEEDIETLAEYCREQMQQAEGE